MGDLFRGCKICNESLCLSTAVQERALPIETKVESGTSQSKSGTSLNLSNSGFSHLLATTSNETLLTVHDAGTGVPRS